MNKFTIFALGLVASFALLAPIAEAQTAGPKGKQAGGQRQGGMQRMAKIEENIFKQLSLTNEQKPRIEAAQKKRNDEMRAVMTGGGDRTQMRPKMRGITENYNKELQKILTPAQWKKYQELRKAEMEKIRKEMGNRRPGGAPGGAPGGGR